IILLSGISVIAEPTADGHDTRPVICEAFMHRGKPGPGTVGLHRVHVLYKSALWPTTASEEDYNEPDLEHLAELAQSLDAGSWICVDIEHWPLNGDDAEIKETVGKLVDVAQTIRRHAPPIKLGFYGVMPRSFASYWPIIRHHQGDSTQY